jgi:2-polyprenyl-3-methyl-5-hydroxy-6-metoxy-1,4-benzoquinol methylase
MQIDEVERYFSSQAPAYGIKSARFPWSLLRSSEMRSVFKLLGDIRGADILELGSGAGFYTRELLARGARHVWAVDLSAAMLEALPRARVTPMQADAATVKVDRRFSVLLSTGMLEFVPEPTTVLRNAAAHADKGARCILLTPRRNFFGYIYRQFHRSHGLQIRLFDRRAFEKIADATGWKVVASRTSSLFSLVTCLQRR